MNNPFSQIVKSFLPGRGKSPAAQGTLEEKLAVLARCGMQLSSPFTVEDLLTSWPREQFEKPGWSMALVGLGMPEEQPPWRNHCENVLHFDTECIEDDGDYVRIAERLSKITQGALELENIRDHVDIEEGNAWLEFSWRGEKVHIDCNVDDDWVDSRIFAHFANLLRRANQEKIYLLHETGGQDCILACVTQKQFAELEHEGVNFKPL